MGTSIPTKAPIRNIVLRLSLSDSHPVAMDEIAVNARLRDVNSPSWVPVAPSATMNIELYGFRLNTKFAMLDLRNITFRSFETP